MAQAFHDCALCGRNRGESRLEQLYIKHSGKFKDAYVVTNVYICNARSSCKIYRRQKRKAHGVDQASNQMSMY